jgi:hypothetical protein
VTNAGLDDAARPGSTPPEVFRRTARCRVRFSGRWTADRSIQALARRVRMRTETMGFVIACRCETSAARYALDKGRPGSWRSNERSASIGLPSSACGRRSSPNGWASITTRRAVARPGQPGVNPATDRITDDAARPGGEDHGDAGEADRDRDIRVGLLAGTGVCVRQCMGAGPERRGGEQSKRGVLMGGAVLSLKYENEFARDSRSRGANMSPSSVGGLQ